jgi:hypothetical protein
VSLRPVVAAAAAAIVLIVMVPAVHAQPRAERPYRGLFASGLGETPQQLTVNASMGTGWDENVLLGTGVQGFQVTDPRHARSGSYGVGSVGLNYSLQRGQFVFGARGVTTGRYYPGIIGNEFVSSKAASVSASQTFGSTRVFGGYSASYQPYNLVTLMFIPPSEGLPDGVELPEEDLSISPIRYTSQSLSAGASHSIQLSERGSLSVNYDYSRINLSAFDHQYWRHGGGVSYSHGIGRGLSAYVGYQLQEIWYPRDVEGSRRLRAHNGNFGINFNRALSVSLSRRVTLSMTTGSSAVGYRNGNTGEMRHRYFITGSAALTREIGRTWSARLGYNRGVNFVETFNQPFLYDSAYASYGGLISRRVSFNARVGGSLGNVGLGVRRPYHAYNARASLNVAISRFVSAGMSYTLSRYRFREDTLLPEGALRFANRQGARASITAWAPLFTRTRRGDAPR